MEMKKIKEQGDRHQAQGRGQEASVQDPANRAQPRGAPMAARCDVTQGVRGSPEQSLPGRGRFHFS